MKDPFPPPPSSYLTRLSALGNTEKGFFFAGLLVVPNRLATRDRRRPDRPIPSIFYRRLFLARLVCVGLSVRVSRTRVRVCTCTSVRRV